MAEILLIDNFDSFTFNLTDEFARRGHTVHVHRNTLAVDDALALLRGFDSPRVVVCPGPGHPELAGCSIELIKRCSVPVLGVCLGHQAIVHAFGGHVAHAPRVLHGKATVIEHDCHGLFAGLESRMRVGRYHSLAATTLGPELLEVARDRDGTVMAVQHRSRPIYGLQFHPESILTPLGGQLLEAFLALEATHA